MTTQDFDQPYMVYEGELPRHLRPRAVRAIKPRPAPQWRATDDLDDEADEAEDSGGLSWFGLVVLAGVLALGVAIGVTGTLMLHARKATPAAPTQVAFEATLAPTAPPPRAAALPHPSAAMIPQLAAMLEPAAAPATPAPAQPQAAPLRLARADGPTPKAAPARPARGCSATGSRADYAVCTNPELAAADLEMRHAYQHALDSGAPQKSLRASQEDWLILSEVAADRSTADLSSVYRRRIAELNALATQDPPH
ncbi:hypothetical protein [Phenylobacterium sp.]|uniref:hypothetical protein n=1 Tax=Phenylobacterium sp. TaxID=1871053 RepID=UPI0035671372